MKQFFFLIVFIFLNYVSKSQNLILNGGFEKNRGYAGTVNFSDSLNNNPQFNECFINDWMRIGGTPDGYWFVGQDFPMNYHSDYIYPHSDSVCVGGFYLFHGMGGGQTTREIIEGKLTKPLITNHHYQFSMYVQLFDTIEGNVIDIGKIVGINSFSAVFTDTMIPSHNYLPITNYKPQVQINQMVIDTQHWVQLIDTFIALGGEQFVSIGNFKPDSLIQYQLVDSIRNLAIASYYFMDDVSLIDLDEVGIEEVEKNKLVVYPNPASTEIKINYKDISQGSRIIIYNLLGIKEFDKPIVNKNSTETIDVSKLSNGLYLFRVVDSSNNTTTKGKFAISK